MSDRSPLAPATPRFDTIDVLRGISILLVVLLHIYLRLFFAGYSLKPLFPRWLFKLLFTNGNNGVAIFFAISGFLITLISLKRFGTLSRMSAATFYRIRFARIAPLLLLVLAVLSLLHLTHAEGFRIPATRCSLARALFAALTFHLNWLEAAHGYLPANWDVLWSLSVEESFYLFFPLFCIALLRRSRGMVVFVAILLLFVLAGPFARTVWTTNAIWQEKSYLGGMDGIALGCLTALLVNRLQQVRYGVRNRHLLAAIQIAGSLAIFLVFLWPGWHWLRYLGRSGTDTTLLSLATCSIMLASVLRSGTGLRWTTPIRWCGRRSYEIYLTHEFVVVWGTALYVKLHCGPLLVWVFLILPLSLVPGAMLARYFSEPMNRKLRGVRPD